MAVPELNKTAQIVQNILGISGLPGGRHEEAGTENFIFPLDGSYLELVTVVDAMEAANNSFGRLVSNGMSPSSSPFTAWVTPLVIDETGPLEASHQILTRAGIQVELFGVDEAIARPDRPIRIRRCPGQPSPAEVPPSARRQTHHILNISLTSPHREASSLTATGGPTTTTTSNMPGRGRILDITLGSPDGRTINLNESLWSQA